VAKLAIEDFAWTVFDPGEHTCFDNSAFGTDVYPIEQGIKAPTAYFSINPLKPGSHRFDANVVSFRNFLIELDDGKLADQMAYVRSLDVPYSTLVFSGGKSLHFLVCLEDSLKTKAAYDVMARRIHAVVTRCDHKTKNASRFARWPGHFREDKGKMQHLLDVRGRTPNEDLEDWLIMHGVDRDPSPPPPPPDTIWEGMKLPPKWKTNRIAREGADYGERNSSLYVAAHDLRESGYSLTEAIEFLLKAPLGDDFSDHEKEQTIRSAYRKSTDGS